MASSAESSAAAEPVLPERRPVPVHGAGRLREKSSEAGETPEAIVARDADKLECLVQAVQYREQDYSLTQNWIDTSLASLKTPSAKALADAALSMDSLQWQQNFLP